MSIFGIPIPYLIVYIIFIISDGDIITYHFFYINEKPSRLTKILAAISTIIVIIYTIYLYKIHGVI